MLMSERETKALIHEWPRFDIYSVHMVQRVSVGIFLDSGLGDGTKRKKKRKRKRKRQRISMCERAGN